MMAYDTDSERELDVRCKILYDLTKEYVENASRATSRLFYWAYHETWMLMAFPKVLASKKAYNLFFEKYKEDIREYAPGYDLTREQSLQGPFQSHSRWSHCQIWGHG